jgi:hypothetical protein
LPICAADRQHIHHRLLSLGLSQRQAVLVVYTACIALCGAALLTTAGRDEVTMVVLGSFGVVAFVCIRVFGRLRLFDLVNRVREDLAHNSRVSAARVAVERVVADMQRAESLEELWSAFGDAFRCLEIDQAAMRLKGGTSSGHLFTWSGSGRECPVRRTAGVDSWSGRLSIGSPSRPLGELLVSTSVRESPLLAEIPDLMDRLRQQAAERLEAVVAIGEGRPEVQAGVQRPAPVQAEAA